MMMVASTTVVASVAPFRFGSRFSLYDSLPSLLCRSFSPVASLSRVSCEDATRTQRGRNGDVSMRRQPGNLKEFKNYCKMLEYMVPKSMAEVETAKWQLNLFEKGDPCLSSRSADAAGRNSGRRAFLLENLAQAEYHLCFQQHRV